MWNEGNIKDLYVAFGHKRQWQYPSTSDAHVPILDEIIPCDIIGS